MPRPAREYAFRAVWADGRYKTYRYFTLWGARRRAIELVGLAPHKGPDGAAVCRTTGNRLVFARSTLFDELFVERG